MKIFDEDYKVLKLICKGELKEVHNLSNTAKSILLHYSKKSDSKISKYVKESFTELNISDKDFIRLAIYKSNFINNIKGYVLTLKQLHILNNLDKFITIISQHKKCDKEILIKIIDHGISLNESLDEVLERCSKLYEKCFISATQVEKLYNERQYCKNIDFDKEIKDVDKFIEESKCRFRQEDLRKLYLRKKFTDKGKTLDVFDRTIKNYILQMNLYDYYEILNKLEELTGVKYNKKSIDILKNEYDVSLYYYQQNGTVSSNLLFANKVLDDVKNSKTKFLDIKQLEVYANYFTRAESLSKKDDIKQIIKNIEELGYKLSPRYIKHLNSLKLSSGYIMIGDQVLTDNKTNKQLKKGNMYQYHHKVGEGSLKLKENKSDPLKDDNYNMPKRKYKRNDLLPSEVVNTFDQNQCLSDYQTDIISLESMNDAFKQDRSNVYRTSNKKCYILSDIIRTWSNNLSLYDSQSLRVVPQYPKNFDNTLVEPEFANEIYRAAIRNDKWKSGDNAIDLILSNGELLNDIYRFITTYSYIEKYYDDLSKEYKDDVALWNKRDLLAISWMKKLYKKYNIPDNGYRKYNFIKSGKTAVEVFISCFITAYIINNGFIATYDNNDITTLKWVKSNSKVCKKSQGYDPETGGLWILDPCKPCMKDIVVV